MSPEGRERARLERTLNDLCRRLVVEIRDRNRCQRCPNRIENAQIHWAHVESRQAKSIQWVEWNSLALCAGCHFWFDAHKGTVLRPSEAMIWWREKFPERALALDAWRQQRRPKVDRQLIRLYLEQQLGERA